MAKITFDKKIKKYSCFTVEQQKEFEGLNPRHRAYVELRGKKGYNKTNAYISAGFKPNNASQASYLLERNHPIIPELIAALHGQTKLRNLTVQDSDINKQIDALATRAGAEALTQIIEDGDAEKARSVQFYRDIIDGKTKTTRKIVRKNANGDTLETKIEYVSDVQDRMKARKELDRILGINESVDLDQLQGGNITFNFVDVGNKEELEDSRNKVVLDPEDVVITEVGGDGENANGNA